MAWLGEHRRLAAVTGERILRLTAEAALRQALGRLPISGCGLYSGGLGVLYVAAEILGDFDKEAVLRQAEPDRSQLDLMDGSAGAIAVLLKLQARSPGTRLLDAAAKHGADASLSRAEPS